MQSPAERPRRPRTVIQWHDDGSKRSARHFLSDDAPPYRALMLAGLMAVVSVAAVASVIQYQRHGHLPEVASLVDTAQASPDVSPRKAAQEKPESVQAGTIQAAALAEPPASSVPAAKSVPTSVETPVLADVASPKSARVELTETAEDVQAPSSAQVTAAGADADGDDVPAPLALVADTRSQTSAVDVAGEVSSAEEALDVLKNADAGEGEPPAALAYAPVETPAKTPLPAAAPREVEVAAAQKPDEPETGSDTATVRSSVNMRAGPSDEAKVLLTIPRGAKIAVAENCRHWCAVSYDGRNGFVYKSFIRR